VNANEYYHFVVTYDGAVIKLYQNGVLVGSTAVVGTLNFNSNDIIIGECDADCNGVQWNGQIDDIAIYNRALSASEIQQLFTHGQISYVWSNGLTTQSINVSPMVTTTYICNLIRDGASCSSSATINVLQPTSASIQPGVCSAYTAPDGSVYTSSGTYQAVIANAQGCDSTITINLTVHPLPIVDAGNDFSVCVGDEITLSGSGASSYTWDNGVNDGVPF
ncbi:MAG: LamG domain-containing protein, partial [Bacteroidota bacterium]